ncbi:MAG: hypothetical protein R3C56_42300 [Pirellulaceae bacterium]
MGDPPDRRQQKWLACHSTAPVIRIKFVIVATRALHRQTAKRIERAGNHVVTIHKVASYFAIELISDLDVSIKSLVPLR